MGEDAQSSGKRSIEEEIGFAEVEFNMKTNYSAILFLWLLCHIAIAEGNGGPCSKKNYGDPCTKSVDCCSNKCALKAKKCMMQRVDGFKDSGKAAIKVEVEW